MTQETFLLNSSFAYVFNLGEYLPMLMAYVISGVILFEWIRRFLTKD